MRADASWYEGVETRATYASSSGHGLIDRTLYLPKSWTEDVRILQLAQLSHLHEGQCPCI
jgi:hypothetical protein